MTTALNCSRRATSAILSTHAQFPRPLSPRYQVLRITAVAYKSYSSSAAPKAEEAQEEADGINAPRSTIPPPLDLPERGDKSAPIYLYRLGRAYGKFYWAGVKATWNNHKKAKELRRHIARKNIEKGAPRSYRPMMAQCEYYVNTSGLHNLTRSDFQLMVREQQDYRRLPPFAFMVALFGEWLPLILPFFPSVVPRTCRIPKQAEDMRKGVENRRRQSFRQGLAIPDIPQRGFEEDVSEGVQKGAQRIPRAYRALQITRHFEGMDKRDQMIHMSRSLGLGGRTFDHFGLKHPLLSVRFMLRLQYLAIDDELLLQDWVMSHLVLTEEETRIACEERGIDIVGRSLHDMKEDLGKWLDGRKRDNGSGKEIIRMLFTRPNTWD